MCTVEERLQVKGFLKAAAACALFTVVVAAGQAFARQGAITLDAILKQLDRSAKNFHSLSADVERTKVTVVVNDRSTEAGTLLVRNDKMLLQMNPPDSRTILRNGDNIYVYTPGLNQVEEYNLGKNRDLADEFLLLGFGTSGSQMEKGFQVKYTGEETIEGKKDALLDLTPRSAAVLKQFSKIQIWLDETTWLPDQQQFTENGGDYLIIRYTKMVRNPNVSDSKFKPHWPKGTEKVKPQG
ncbi:MAG TPA: outer membrane lipoprotein carrier protein LolA [Candidatus Acidoferrales bacterium]|nr:outer membrane lipoprotein carrier protein LolA [Candidatus Acidoferrales bacterium]